MAILPESFLLEKYFVNKIIKFFQKKKRIRQEIMNKGRIYKKLDNNKPDKRRNLLERAGESCRVKE